MDQVQFKIRKLNIQKSKGSTNSANATFPIQYLSDEIEDYVREPRNKIDKSIIWIKINNNDLFLCKIVPKPKIHVKQFLSSFLSETLDEGKAYFDTEMRIIENPNPSVVQSEELDGLRQENKKLKEQLAIYKQEIKRIVSENDNNLSDFKDTMKLFISQIDEAFRKPDPKGHLIHIFESFEETIPLFFEISVDLGDD